MSTVESLFVIPATVLNPLGQDDGYGNLIDDWDNAESTELMVWLAQNMRSEDIVGRDARLSTWVLYAPEDAPITAKSRVIAHDVTYRVTGPPWVAVDPLGTDGHLEATLTQTDG